MAKQPEPQSAGGLRALAFLVLAGMAGATAVYVVFTGIQYYKAQIAAAKAPEEMALAIRAAKELYPGVVINEDDIVGVRIPKKYVPAEALLTPEDIVHRTPRERILANEFIMPDRLANGESGVGLNALIPNGWRAISVNIGDGQAVSGFLNPGNKVDLLVTITDDETGINETTTLLQTVPVLAVNGRMLKEEIKEDPADGKKKKKTKKMKPSVTLAVTPEQAEQVAHAEQRGEIALTLRNDEDVVLIETDDPVDKNTLIGKEEDPKPTPPVGKRPPKKDPPKEEPPGLQVYLGGKQTEMNSDGTQKKKQK